MGWPNILCGLIGMVLTHWLGVWMAKTRPCRWFFVVRILVGIPVYLYWAYLVYLGFLRR